MIAGTAATTRVKMSDFGGYEIADNPKDPFTPTMENSLAHLPAGGRLGASSRQQGYNPGRHGKMHSSDEARGSVSSNSSARELKGAELQGRSLIGCMLSTASISPLY